MWGGINLEKNLHHKEFATSQAFCYYKYKPIFKNFQEKRGKKTNFF